MMTTKHAALHLKGMVAGLDELQTEWTQRRDRRTPPSTMKE